MSFRSYLNVFLLLSYHISVFFHCYQKNVVTEYCDISLLSYRISVSFHCYQTWLEMIFFVISLLSIRFDDITNINVQFEWHLHQTKIFEMMQLSFKLYINILSYDQILLSKCISIISSLLFFNILSHAFLFTFIFNYIKIWAVVVILIIIINYLSSLLSFTLLFKSCMIVQLCDMVH